jgi:hypothetical protein
MMDTGESVFTGVICAGSRRQKKRVKRLAGRELQDLIGWLGRNLDENGLTGELMGVCLHEAVARLAKKKRKNS